MKILIEGESYPLETLEYLFHSGQYYSEQGPCGSIQGVGYYHSYKTNELVYMLPKVFMKDRNQTIFGYSPERLLKIENVLNLRNSDEYRWIRQISVFFYNSLIEFRKRAKGSQLLNRSESFELSTNIGMAEYSYLDILLSFVNYYKKNTNYILFTYKNQRSGNPTKVKWEKTVRKNIPSLMSGQVPIYTQYTSKKKHVNPEEMLLTYFFSILNYFNEEHLLSLRLNIPYKVIKGARFKRLQKNGLKKLRKLKHQYFNDHLRKIYRLCEIYFSSNDKASVRYNQYDYLFITGYNTVFENMIDKLFSDEISVNWGDHLSISDLKNNPDGKIIDHLYRDISITDTSNIFYIGDSKYYKTDREANALSEYKQYTYAKNIIQFNIDLLNNDKNDINIRYRDKLTEGYNITPNFFIYGYLGDLGNFDEPNLIKMGEPSTSSHYRGRLFDRDTLFVHKYRINYLFVLKAYTAINKLKTQKFRMNARMSFRRDIIEFFNDSDRCKYLLYKCKKDSTEIAEFVETNFRHFLGKCFYNSDDELLLAVHEEDTSFDHYLNDFEPHSLR